MAQYYDYESSEVETLRRTLLDQSKTIDSLKNQITELNEQLYGTYKRIKKEREKPEQMEFIYW